MYTKYEETAVNKVAQILEQDDGFVQLSLQGMSNIQYFCHVLAANSGWHKEYHDMPEEYRKHWIAGKMALIHSEISEAVEGLRKGKKDDHLPHLSAVQVELADALIRIFDLAGLLGLELSSATIEKLAYNQQRADHKPEARAAEGGKGF